MKSKNIIYGVSGMLEYQALINVGGAKMKIPFTNGSSNEAGRTPATFSTNNPIVQMAIENSKEFKSGLIHIVHSVETDKDVYIESDHVALQSEDEGNSALINESELVLNTTENATVAGKNSADEQMVNGNEDKGQGEPEEAGSIDTVTSKEFTCNDDAKDFLETEFGAKRSTLRSRDAIVAFGKSNGVDIKFVD